MLRLRMNEAIPLLDEASCVKRYITCHSPVILVTVRKKPSAVKGSGSEYLITLVTEYCIPFLILVNSTEFVVSVHATLIYVEYVF
jgi:hypothetical protein